MFSYLYETEIVILAALNFSSANAFNWLPAFSPFPTMFSYLSETEIVILAALNFSSANAFNWLPAFSPFPTMFSYLSETEIVILAALNFSSANAFNLVDAKILSSGKRLTRKGNRKSYIYSLTFFFFRSTKISYTFFCLLAITII